MADPRAALVELARLHGVVPVYRANDQSVCEVGTETLLRILAALGTELRDAGAAADAVRARRQAIWRQVVSPVVASWLPGVITIPLRLPADAGSTVRVRAVLENGDAWQDDPHEPTTLRVREVEGTRFRRAEVAVGRALPEGYHRGTIEVDGDAHEFSWIVAPRRAHAPDPRTSGVFVPLYALHSARRQDCAGLREWEELATWAGEAGVRFLGTLPLCAAFLEPPVEASPYAPVSRLFWNEVYVDFEALPEFAHSREAQALAAAVRDAPPDPDHVDWPAVAEHRRHVLAACAARHFADDPEAMDQGLRAFVARRPEVERFARFRAMSETNGRNWRDWPTPARDGRIVEDVEPEVFHRHLYAQWRMQQQVDAMLSRMRAGGTELYLDLPLGVHPDGYDSWAFRDEFLEGCSAGAPPDPFFTKGQDWGFAPLDPVASRRSGHGYFRACLRHQLAHCGLLRVDHVMGLHRVWCVPHGMAADRGAYLRQPAEELYAIATLESNRHACAIVGEDLGTVPFATARALEEHGMLSMHVLQFELAPGQVRKSLTPGARSLSALNTHDMPTFAAYWNAADVADREDLDLLDPAAAAKERHRRQQLEHALALALAEHGEHLDGGDSQAALRATLHALARSDAAVLMVSLEDLWSETRPQNTPGTSAERRNWQRRARPSLDLIRSQDELRARLEDVVRARGGASDGG